MKFCSRLLKNMGLTPQKPMKKAYEQSSAAVRKWLKEEYPKIQERAKATRSESDNKKLDIILICNDLEVSTSGYYAWLKRPPSARKLENERLWQKIKKHWDDSRKTYGHRRIAKKLRQEGEVIGKNRVSKIMQKNNIQGVGKKKFKPMTTTSNHELPVAERIFKTEIAEEQVTRPNQYWGGDITYIATEEGWLYLAIVIDLFTRKAVGHAMSESMPCELVINALDMGLKRQGITATNKLITHTDRGSQVRSLNSQSMLRSW